MIEKDPKLLEVKNLVGRNFSEMAEDFEETEILEYLNQRRS
jgi:hypothetical protein